VTSLLERAVDPRAHPVLVVDDEEANRQLLVSLLRSHGYPVLATPDGASAVELLRTRPVGLVLLDVVMPRMDGIEVCAFIRRELELHSLPVVFCTSLTDRESRVRAKKAGADDFLSKPIDGLELLVRVENLLALRMYREQSARAALACTCAREGALEELDLAQVAREAVARLQQLGRAPAQRVELVCPAGGAPVLMRRPQLEQVVFHLLFDALAREGESEDSLRVCVEAGDGLAPTRLMVTDTAGASLAVELRRAAVSGAA
jgi:CheY-like chemotaxis protein